ncbi:MAG: DinB family protein [Chitinophagaceae bacterium]
MQSSILIEKLISQTQQNILTVQQLQKQNQAYLSWKENSETWSILECIEHLNRYSDFYLPQIAQKIAQSSHGFEATFNSGWLGGYFAKTMLPKEKLNKMKTFKDKNPLNAIISVSVLDTFVQQQTTLLSLLQQSKKVSLNKIKIETTLSKYLKLNLGDTFQFFVNHIIRHLYQIERIQKAMNQ